MRKKRPHCEPGRRVAGGAGSALGIGRALPGFWVYSGLRPSPPASAANPPLVLFAFLELGETMRRIRIDGRRPGK